MRCFCSSVDSSRKAMEIRPPSGMIWYVLHSLPASRVLTCHYLIQSSPSPLLSGASFTFAFKPCLRFRSQAHYSPWLLLRALPLYVSSSQCSLNLSGAILSYLTLSSSSRRSPQPPDAPLPHPVLHKPFLDACSFPSSVRSRPINIVIHFCPLSNPMWSGPLCLLVAVSQSLEHLAEVSSSLLRCRASC